MVKVSNISLIVGSLLNSGLTAAERIKTQKDKIEREFTLAQERAHDAFSTGKGIVEREAKKELDAILTSVDSATERLRKLVDIDALPSDAVDTAKTVKEKLDKTADRDT